MTPAQLGYCIKGHELKRKEQDSDMWHFAGTYGISALIYAIDRCLNGKKARSEYIKKPVSILLEDLKATFLKVNRNVVLSLLVNLKLKSNQI